MWVGTVAPEKGGGPPVKKISPRQKKIGGTPKNMCPWGKICGDGDRCESLSFFTRVYKTR